MSDEFEIRTARFDDAAQIAEIHVKSWQQAYTGQIPQDYLDSLDALKRQEKWKNILDKSSTGETNICFAFKGGKAGGFVNFGRHRDEDKKDCGEIYAIYLLNAFWGKGMGYALFQKATHVLLNKGFSKAYIWVLESNNRAINSYTKWGGIINAGCSKSSEVGGQSLREISLTFTLY